MIKKFRIVSIVMALSLGLMACSGNDDSKIPVEEPPVVEASSQTETVTPDAQTPVEPETPTDNAGSKIDETMMMAADIFEKYMMEFPELKFKEMSLDKDFSNYIYKLEGSDNTGEHEFKINAQDGSLIKKELDKDIDFTGEITKDHVAKIDSFVDQALTDAGSDAKLDEWSLKVDDKIVKIEIDIDMGLLKNMEYTYDVNSGTLLEKEN